MTVSSPTEFHNRNTPEPLLRISGLTTCYGESRILRDVDLQVHGGQMVCLIGRNGVGKTTLLKTVMGLIRPQRGRIHLAGRDLLALPPHQRARAGIGYVPQGRDIIPQLTVRDNLRLGLEARPGGLARHDRLDPQVFDLFP
ncbi:ATP-binding cassette domain-containing protein, partial [Candidatus Synechococcus spongiarum]